MFKVIFIRIIIKMIKKTLIIIITRVFSIETIFNSTIKSKSETFKEFMCYIYNKIGYYKQDYMI